MRKPPEKKTVGDAAQSIIKGALGVVPYGGTIGVLLETVFSGPLDKRKREWFRELAEVITDLEKRVEGLTPNNLSKNEAFISIALTATQMALKTHQQEKLRALKNAVFNSGKSSSVAEDLQMVFLRLVDDLTPWHLRLMTMLQDPVEWMKQNNVTNPGWSMGGGGTVIEHCFPELRKEREFYSQLYRELVSEGLVTRGDFIGLTMTGSSMIQSRTTDMGKKFLNFISLPYGDSSNDSK